MIKAARKFTRSTLPHSSTLMSENFLQKLIAAVLITISIFPYLSIFLKRPTISLSTLISTSMKFAFFSSELGYLAA